MRFFAWTAFISSRRYEERQLSQKFGQNCDEAAQVGSRSTNTRFDGGKLDPNDPVGK